MKRRIHLSSLSCSLFLGILLLSASSVANANTIAYSEDPDPPVPKRLEFDVGLMVGNMDLGTELADATGLNVNLGMRFGELSILGEVNQFGVRADERGKMTRVGLTTRYSLVPIGDEKSFATGDVWIEGGLGYERLAWNSGGVLERPDAAFGVGWQANFVMDRNSAHPRYLGPFFALRTLVAPGPESDEMATCGGPCDRATPPSATDVSFMFSMGLNWGRLSFSER